MFTSQTRIEYWKQSAFAYETLFLHCRILQSTPLMQIGGVCWALAHRRLLFLLPILTLAFPSDLRLRQANAVS
jgi:hypothetical protein